MTEEEKANRRWDPRRIAELTRAFDRGIITKKEWRAEARALGWSHLGDDEVAARETAIPVVPVFDEQSHTPHIEGVTHGH